MITFVGAILARTKHTVNETDLFDLFHGISILLLKIIEMAWLCPSSMDISSIKHSLRSANANEQPPNLVELQSTTSSTSLKTSSVVSSDSVDVL